MVETCFFTFYFDGFGNLNLMNKIYNLARFVLMRNDVHGELLSVFVHFFAYLFLLNRNRLPNVIYEMWFLIQEFKWELKSIGCQDIYHLTWLELHQWPIILRFADGHALLWQVFAPKWC